MAVGVLAPRNQANTHDHPDTDSSAAALHHTLGGGGAQAAAGSHGHSAPGLLYLFGQGEDGDFVLDGAATPAWAGRAGSVYTLSREANLANLTINAGVELRMNGFRLYCSGTLTNRGSITHPGGDAAGQIAGAGSAVNATRSVSGAGSQAGKTGVASGNGTAGAGGNVGPVMGGAGGAGGASGGGANGGNGGAVGTYTGGSAQSGPSRSLITILTGGMPLSGASPVSVQAGNGGGGGGCTSGGSTGYGGASGGGGGVVIIGCTVLDNAGGIIRARGGNGSDGALIGGTTGSGGGGGGGGGVVMVTYGSAIALGTIDAPGGAHGNGAGTGVAGSDGSAGTVVVTRIGNVV